ncbi:MAG: hypothetical protein Q8867_09800 [Bacteroidota bacterium]|nr:hypothetical protein [Bacteroidota bacterium]
MKKTGTLLILFSLLLLVGCRWGKDRLNIDVSHIKIPETKIHRYDRDLFKVPVNDLQKGLGKLLPEYRYFLGDHLTDTAKLSQMMNYLQNPRNIDFYQACQKKYTDLSSIEKGLNDAFRHYRYYFPDEKIPSVYSYVSGGDYQHPVMISDSVVILALDDYLGKTFSPYFSDGLPMYKVQRMTADNIVPDIMKALLTIKYPYDPMAVNMLESMIDAGRHLYLMDAVMPAVSANLKIGYTPAQYKWAEENESHIWASMIENQMLYSADARMINIFMSDGPFTSEFARESPPRLGEWIGWNIVKAYMKHHKEVTLPELMQEKDAQKILTMSGYKPEK